MSAAQKTAILTQVGHFYFGAVGQFYFGANNLSGLDLHLRQKYGCSVLLVHHTGHSDKGRHRGSIVLASNTDQELRVVRKSSELVAQLDVVRMKDHAPADSTWYRGHVVNTGVVDEDDMPITSLALGLVEKGKTVRTSSLGGANQRKLWSRLETWLAMGGAGKTLTFEDIEAMAKEVGLSKRSARLATIDGLLNHGAILETAGGYLVNPD